MPEIPNVGDSQRYPEQPHAWTRELPAAPDRTAELPVTPVASFWADPEKEFADDKPRHEKPRNRRRIVPGVPWFLAAAAVLVALVSAADPFGATTLMYPSPTAQPAPAPRPAVTRTVRVTAPAVTVQAAPRPAETVYVTATATAVVTKTADPKTAVTVTKTVTADPEQAPDE